jgi:RNA polymerase sigma-70 factor (ECF subfamily)
MSQLSEQFLVLRCQTGDEAAFRRLYELFGDRSLRYLHGLLGADAEDVHQDVWLTVYRRIGGLANPAGFRTWLFATTRNRALDHLRRLRREADLLSPDAVEDHDIGTPDAEPDIDSQAIDSAINTLPPMHREILILRFRDDLRYAEIALIVGCSIGTVRSRLHHAKRQLSTALEKQDPTAS